MSAKAEISRTGFRETASRAVKEVKIIFVSGSYQRAKLDYVNAMLSLGGKTGENVTSGQINDVLITALHERQRLMKLNKLGVDGFGTANEDQVAVLAKAQDLQTPEGTQAAKAWFANAAAMFYIRLKEDEDRGIVSQGDRRNFKAISSAIDCLSNQNPPNTHS